MRKNNILIVDDDPNIRKLLGDLLSPREDYHLLMAADGVEAMNYLTTERVDVVFTDIHMPGFTGLELMADIQKIGIKPEILVMTANGTEENVETARTIGARSLILKPFDNLDVVEGEIEKAVQAAV
ncbi:MAG: response regulator, partial [Acidobacteriota bacterium]